jgi:hypothetical protein
MGMGYCKGGRAAGNSLEVVVPMVEKETVPVKWCRRCREWLGITKFYGDASKHDGMSDLCKKCDNFTRGVRRQKGK